MSKKVGSDKLKAGVVKVDKMDFPYTIRKDRKTKPLYARFGREVKNYKDDGTPVYRYKYNVSAKDEFELKVAIKNILDGIEEESTSRTLFVNDIKRWLKDEYWSAVVSDEDDKDGITRNTYDRIEVTVNQILSASPFLLATRVSDITPDDCRQILRELKNKYADSSFKKVKTCLNSYFKAKVRNGEITKNPLEAIHERHGNKGKSKNGNQSVDEDNNLIFLTDDEIEKIKKVINDGYDYTSKSRSNKTYTAHGTIAQGKFFIFMLNSGLRAGEAVALKYSDIDFEKSTMTVRRNIVRVKKRDKDGNPIYKTDKNGNKIKKINYAKYNQLVKTKGKDNITEDDDIYFVDFNGNYQYVVEYEKQECLPKTSESYATVKINSKCIEILKEMLKDEPEGYNSYIVHEQRKASDSSKPVESISTNALYKRWVNLCTHAGVPTRGLHCLRHSCASHLFAVTKGNALFVKELLRHSDVSFTEQIYVSIIDKYRQEVFEEFEI